MAGCNKIFYYRASLRKHIEASHLNYVLENNIKDPYTEVIEILKQNNKTPKQHAEHQSVSTIHSSTNCSNTFPLPTNPAASMPSTEATQIMARSETGTTVPSIPTTQSQKQTIDTNDVTLLINKWPQELNSSIPIKFISNYDIYEGRTLNPQLNHELTKIRTERILDPIAHPHVHQEYCSHLKIYHHNHMDYLHDAMLHMVVEYGNYNIRPNLRA
jgi:hypothetical protein